MEQSSLVASRSLVSTTRRSRFLCSGLLTCRVGATATASINFAQAGAKVFERWSNRLALVPSLIKMKPDTPSVAPRNNRVELAASGDVTKVV